MKLYQYAIFYDPTEEQKKKGDKPTIIQDVTTILATDEKSVLIQAAKVIPETYTDRLDQVQIVIRPF